MNLIITPIFLAIFIAFQIILSFRVINTRRKHGVRLGDGGNSILQDAIRAHGNFSEYVPMFTVALAVLELQQVHWLIILMLGSVMLLGRACHAYGILKYEVLHPDSGMKRFKFRILGMQNTFAALVLSALALVSSVLFS